MRPIDTARLTLEPQVAAHAEEMFAVLSDPAIYQYENEPPPSLEWLRKRYARLETRQSASGDERWLNWVVRLRPSHLIGYVQATLHADGRAAIAYELASAFWGQGYAGEAVAAMIAELFGHYEVTRLSAVLKQDNQRSLRLLERLGFSSAPPDSKIELEPGELLMRYSP